MVNDSKLNSLSIKSFNLNAMLLIERTCFHSNLSAELWTVLQSLPPYSFCYKVAISRLYYQHSHLTYWRVVNCMQHIKFEKHVTNRQHMFKQICMPSVCSVPCLTMNTFDHFAKKYVPNRIFPRETGRQCCFHRVKQPADS